LVLLFAFLLIWTSCATRKPVVDKQGQALDHLLALMTGEFSSAEQAQNDTLFYDISLAMYPIWKDDASAKWLYVEQAVTIYFDQPYRQRVYRVAYAPDGSIESRVYELPQPERFIHGWKKEGLFDGITPDSLQLREGCSVFLKPKGDNCFAGATKPNACGSTLRGATYASSQVEICDGQIVSWDQGWDDKGEQVWGAETEGYVFKRK
jgi:CpeT protein